MLLNPNIHVDRNCPIHLSTQIEFKTDIRALNDSYKTRTKMLNMYECLAERKPSPQTFLEDPERKKHFPSLAAEN